MSLHVILLTALTVLWVAFEIWLMIRDRAQGKGKTVRDRGQGTTISSQLLLA